jgi:hypothetical protein
MEDRPSIPRNDVSIGDMRIASEDASASEIVDIMERVLKNKNFREYLDVIKSKKAVTRYTG